MPIHVTMTMLAGTNDGIIEFETAHTILHDRKMFTIKQWIKQVLIRFFDDYEMDYFKNNSNPNYIEFLKSNYADYRYETFENSENNEGYENSENSENSENNNDDDDDCDDDGYINGREPRFPFALSYIGEDDDDDDDDDEDEYENDIDHSSDEYELEYNNWSTTYICQSVFEDLFDNWHRY
jgi:hypothetical protein